MISFSWNETQLAYPSGIGIKSSCRFDTVYDLYTFKEKPHYSLFAGHVSYFTEMIVNSADLNSWTNGSDDNIRSGQSMVSNSLISRKCIWIHIIWILLYFDSVLFILFKISVMNFHKFQIYFKTGSGRTDGTNAQLMVYFGKNCRTRVCDYTKGWGFTVIQGHFVDCLNPN